VSYAGVRICLFKIVSEGSVASGVRRIEAVTGRAAYAKITEQQALLDDISRHLKVPQQEIVKKAEKVLKEIKDLQKRKTEIRTGQINLEDILDKAYDFSGIKLITQLIPDVEEVNLRSLVDLIKQRLPMSVCLLATEKEKKAILVMGITEDLLKIDFNAGDFIKQVTQIMNGSGGGREDFAFGAGDIQKLEAGFSKLKDIIKNRS
jgi:alanyl-tRNA synthetase